jgi:hypothetical protein
VTESPEPTAPWPYLSPTHISWLWTLPPLLELRELILRLTLSSPIEPNTTSGMVLAALEQVKILETHLANEKERLIFEAYFRRISVAEIGSASGISERTIRKRCSAPMADELHTALLCGLAIAAMRAQEIKQDAPSDANELHQEADAFLEQHPADELIAFFYETMREREDLYAGAQADQWDQLTKIHEQVLGNKGAAVLAEEMARRKNAKRKSNRPPDRS